MKKWLVRSGVPGMVVLVAIQFVPVTGTNAPVESDIVTSLELKAVLRRTCYDCHSYETVWPWYSRIAPVSWMIVRDVTKGRKELNFSVWGQYNAKRQARKLKEIREQIEKGKMPQWYYVALHPNAKLSPGDREMILKWAGRL